MICMDTWGLRSPGYGLTLVAGGGGGESRQAANAVAQDLPHASDGEREREKEGGREEDKKQSKAASVTGPGAFRGDVP